MQGHSNHEIAKAPAGATAETRIVPKAAPGAPHPENRVSGRMTCRTCDVQMSRGMLAWHLRNDHAFLKCRICATDILRTGLVLSSLHTADFCSRACLEECVRRGLCGDCFKEPDPSFAKGYCLPCRITYRRRQAALYRGLKTVNQAVNGINQAAHLPAPYHRSDRETA